MVFLSHDARRRELCVQFVHVTAVCRDTQQQYRAARLPVPGFDSLSRFTSVEHGGAAGVPHVSSNAARIFIRVGRGQNTFNDLVIWLNGGRHYRRWLSVTIEQNDTTMVSVRRNGVVLRSPKLPVLTKSTATGITVSGAQSFKPVAWQLDNDGNKVNVDNRFATVTLSATTGLKRGDKISFAGVKFLGQMAKNVLAQDATFSVVRVVDATHVEITPKPVALDDVSLSPEQRAYANVNTSLADAMAVNILNVKDARTNVFWADDAIRIVSQPIPANHELFAGMKTTSFSIPDVGLNGIFATQGDISPLSGLCRIALWYGVNATRPEAIGVGLPGQTA